MNGISTDALVGLAGVALGAFISLIGVWIEGRREARRIADQRRYERVKDRVDRIEPLIARMDLVATRIGSAATTVCALTRIWADSLHLSEASQLQAKIGVYLDTLKQVLEDARTIQEEGPGIILDSLEPQVLDRFDELRDSFSSLYVVADSCRADLEEAIASKDVGDIRSSAEPWRREVEDAHETFKAAYKNLVMAIGHVSEHRGERASWVQRLREWWGRREG